ncbi:hypothetical protein NIES25_31480 [Nostoc linckia NIES-25]|nr:hypothetical protein NIES25_31480 [Nostoc linckia NIES-25]
MYLNILLFSIKIVISLKSQLTLFLEVFNPKDLTSRIQNSSYFDSEV